MTGTGGMTATLATVAALLNSLDLDAFRDQLAAEVRAAAEADDPSEPDSASAKHRRARRGALLAAVAAAREFSSCIDDAMAHNRAVVRALELEASAREEAAAVLGGVVLPMRTLHPRTGSLLHDTFPGARVIPIDRLAAINLEGEPYEPA